MRTNDRIRSPLMLRVMLQEDLRQLLEIEADSFKHPWSEQDFIEHLENPRSVGLVIEQHDLIVGYMAFGIEPSWVQLYSCVVRRACRRQGFGSRMVANLLRVAFAQQGSGTLVIVPERNVGAQLFFRRCRFRAVRILPGYLLDGQDAYVMKYSVPGWAASDSDVGRSEDELIPVWEVKHS